MRSRKLFEYPKVKICGITNSEDASRACEYGADLLGFNFYKKSPRYINPVKVKQIIKKLPPFIVPVGIFVNAPLNEVKGIIKQCALRAVQFHGDETPAYCNKFKKQVLVIKAFRVRNANGLEQIKKYNVDAILLDTFIDSQRIYGGTGKTFDWNIALCAKNLHKYVILSGGLSPKNIQQAVKKVHPYAVDTASGVEKSAGKKDAKLVKEFINNVKKRQAD